MNLDIKKVDPIEYLNNSAANSFVILFEASDVTYVVSENGWGNWHTDRQGVEEFPTKIFDRENLVLGYNEALRDAQSNSMFSNKGQLVIKERKIVENW